MAQDPIPLFSLLPIEVNKKHFQAIAQSVLKKDLSLSDLLPHVQTLLQKTQAQAIKLSKLSANENQDLLYTQAITALQTLRYWVSYLKEVSSEQQSNDLLALNRQMKEIKDLLSSSLPQLVQRRESLYANLPEILKTSIEQMEQKTEQLMKKVSLTYGVLPAERFPLAQQLIGRLFKDLQDFSSTLIVIIRENLNGWNTQVLTEGRDLLLEKTEDLPCSFLFSLKGHCYPLFEAREHLLGRGADKIVFRTIELPTGKMRAAIRPITEEDSEKGKDQFFNMWAEADFLLQLQNTPGVMHLEERCAFEKDEKKRLFLIEHYYWDGSLQSYFDYTIRQKSSQGKLPPDKLQEIIRQLLEGLVAIHKAGIIHHDIKPDNILIDDSEEQIIAAFTDFHLAAYARDTYRLERLRCRAPHASPEYAKIVLNSEKEKGYASVGTPALDVWATGVIFYTLITHSPLPWLPTRKKKQKKESEKEPEEDSTKSVMRKGEREIFEKVADLKAGWHKEALKDSAYLPLLNKMLEIDPKERCTAKQALKLLNNHKLGAD